MIALLVGLLSVVPHFAHAKDCSTVPGAWDWSNGGVITFLDDHSVLYDGTPAGTWKCTDPRHDGVTVSWNTGYIDAMVFSDDRASSRNQIGVQSSGTRSRKSAALAPAIDFAHPSQSSGTRVVMASGDLQRCLGITEGSAKMTKGPDGERYCARLPGADAYNRAGARFKAGDHAGAAKLLADAAKDGNALAQLRLAIMFEAGDGVSRDPRSARMWYGRAAELGEPASQMELGGYYEEADGIPENWDLAASLYRASAIQGWMKGQSALGRAYQFGIGVPQNRQQAIAWFRKAAAQGNAGADYYARWLADPTNNIGFRTDAEHDLVIAGKLRFALGAADPAGITFHNSRQRIEWLRGLGAQVNASEAQVMWQLGKDEYDGCMRNGGANCRSPGPRPGR